MSGFCNHMHFARIHKARLQCICHRHAHEVNHPTIPRLLLIAYLLQSVLDCSTILPASGHDLIWGHAAANAQAAVNFHAALALRASSCH